MQQTHAEYTPELQQRRRDRAFKPFFPREDWYNTAATKDNILHFVRGYGEVNPLYRDAEYAKKSKYGRIIAPPCFLFSAMWGTPGVGASGIHGWYSGGQWEWYQPIMEGDGITVVCMVDELVEKHGRTGAGRTWLDYRRNIYVNPKGEVLGTERAWSTQAERSRAGGVGKYRHIPKPAYSEADLEKIGQAYENEEIRGANPRYWEDVKVGDKLGPVVYGPLSIRDIIAWIMGEGSPFLERAHREQYEWVKKHPRGVMPVSETGDKDSPELVHVLDSYAREVGIERAYDYGCQRMTWLHKLYTNWMGDDGFLWKMRGELRRFNMIGDTVWFEGRVTNKYIDGGKCCVDVEGWATTHTGETSMPVNPATIILPSRQYGPVVYPTCQAEINDLVKRARPLSEVL